jgi:hypothetical protein
MIRRLHFIADPGEIELKHKLDIDVIVDHKDTALTRHTVFP